MVRWHVLGWTLALKITHTVAEEKDRQENNKWTVGMLVEKKGGEKMKINTNRDGTGLMPERLAPFAPKPPQVHIVYPSDNQLPGYVSHPYNHTADCLVSCIITSLNFEKHL